MNFKDLVEGECGGPNPLMRIAQQVTSDRTMRDEGISRMNDVKFHAGETSFRMDMLLKEMQEMDRIIHQPVQAPSVKSEVSKLQDIEQIWNAQGSSSEKLTDIWEQSVNPNPIQAHQSRTDAWNFDQPLPSTSSQGSHAPPYSHQYRPYQRPNYSQFLTSPLNQTAVLPGQPTADDFFKEVEAQKKVSPVNELGEDWAKSFEETKKAEEEFNEQYNKEFWNKLADEWKKLSEDSSGHPWLNELSDYYDPFKEYTYIKENPMLNVENALEKGKEFLKNGDIPSAVICFEAAVQQEAENAEAWQLLGISQAENEKDPNAIVALKKALELNNLNLQVLMALAISYTNESYQNQALKMLNQWMQVNPKYSDLYNSVKGETAGVEEIASSRIRGMEMENTQELFLRAVQQNAEAGDFDVDVQEALGVLFNLSSEYDKAVDCFQTAVQMAPENAKLWNRLGASYANGNRPTEAVAAYQKALEIEPGFIRARYNVGVVCINLKSFKEAAEHLLVALNHQATSKLRAGINIPSDSDQMSDTLWSTLKMTISLLGRHELQDLIDKKDIESLKKEFGV